MPRRLDGVLATVIGDLLGCSFGLDRRINTAATPPVDPYVRLCGPVTTVLLLLALICGLLCYYLFCSHHTHLAISAMADPSNATNRQDVPMDVDEQGGSLPFPAEMMDTGVWREQFLNM